MARIAPFAPPYEADVEQALRKWMPPGVTREPLALFRVLQRHPGLAARMRVLGAGLLTHGEVPALDREIVIARVTARCGCRYEWGVHAAVYAATVGLTPDRLEATVSGDSGHPAWSARHRALIRAVDELHDTATVSDGAWAALAEHYPASQLLELLVLAGWYRTIAYVANGVRLEEESWAAPYPGR
ncbi:carboxymuconolactone decarboxylase family protein [Amycolatopsis sp. QT-25]|uniref:carboxymuconolactone decarboxylase family protein n=1 Tax=Amycolatopsis sp. QT-25 TaxID=3034022 RepID=UPI0023EB26A3|nr:carboxymuconolactone decarboxylase family protein [Amycolatopsis sp. QT-25]WET82751.1 carboxymuconolactone decarboxylase family protein [Amycolatopsis sp. QT-25]